MSNEKGTQQEQADKQFVYPARDTGANIGIHVQVPPLKKRPLEEPAVPENKNQPGA